jgi:hypothetical protein
MKMTSREIYILPDSIYEDIYSLCDVYYNLERHILWNEGRICVNYTDEG